VKIDKQGISKQFLSYFQNLDKSVGERALGPDRTISGKVQSTVGRAVQQAKIVDEEKGYLKALQDVSFFFFAMKGLFIFYSLKQYYMKAISSPLGQRVRAFYTESSKQVQDIHEEARRIADHDKSSASKQATSEESASEEPQAESKKE
jgi:hypothetical protein